MSELSKQELIEILKVNAHSNPDDRWDRGYDVATEKAINLAELLPDTPKKVVVLLPAEIIRHLESFKREKPELLEALGEGWGDMAWFENAENQEKYAQAWITGEYEVEQPKRYSVKLISSVVSSVEGWFKDWSTPEIPTLTTIQDNRFLFEDKHHAELVAELIGGEVEEV